MFVLQGDASQSPSRAVPQRSWPTLTDLTSLPYTKRLMCSLPLMCCFLLTLQGHIALDQAVFPEGTPGLALDTLARAPLWRLGLNYRHGTGHGVGAALNVHEGPHSISTRSDHFPISITKLNVQHEVLVPFLASTPKSCFIHNKRNGGSGQYKM